VVVLETELNRERGERKKCDLYMERILKEIELKAPVFSQQKKDYERAMESHQIMETEVRGAKEGMFMAERNLETVTREWEKEVNNGKVLKEENRNFAQQIQHFLREKMQQGNDDNNDGDDVMMITDGSNDNLFKNIDELQTNNASLIRNNTEPSLELKTLTESDDRMSLRETVKSTERELNRFRQERSEQETIVQSIVEQRDMYIGKRAKRAVRTPGGATTLPFFFVFLSFL